MGLDILSGFSRVISLVDRGFSLLFSLLIYVFTILYDKKLLRYLFISFVIAVVLVVKLNQPSATVDSVKTVTVGSAVTPNGKPSCDCYPKAALAADAGICSTVGKDILKRNGSAVDAAIAALLCLSVVNVQSLGIGGGAVFIIYNATTGKVETIDARENAPIKASAGMFKNKKNPGLYIAVPGELRGYKLAHERHGRLPWRDLFEPSLKLAIRGFPIGNALAKAMKENEKLITNNTALCATFCDSNGKLLKEKDIIRFPELAVTYCRIADEGPDAFYNGALTQKIVDDIELAGGIITRQDLEEYQPELKEHTLSFTVRNYTVFTPDAPFGGPVLALILNILEGYNLSNSSLSEENKTLTYHRMIETFRAAFNEKDKLDDLRNKNEISAFIQNMMSQTFADEIRSTINDDTSKQYSSKNNKSLCASHGTSHLSIIAEDGSAVSVTSSINDRFGSKVISSSTGIIFNNQMCDFRYPERIQPREKPPSSMSPTIIMDTDSNRNDTKVRMVLGGSGGQNISTSVAQVILNYPFFFDFDLHKAVTEPRVYGQLNPNKTLVETNFDKEGIKALEKKNHNIFVTNDLGKVQVVARKGAKICAQSDERKGGYPDGY